MTAVAALKSVATFMAAILKRRDMGFKDIKQIINTTSSSWLVHGLATANREHFHYRDLSYECDEVVDKLGKRTGVRPIVKFWKVCGTTMAQQLAEATLKGWEGAQDQVEFETESETDD